MASVNKVIIVGNLGQAPETRYMPNGDAVTNISVATTESWKDKNSGEKKELTEWHRITFYRKLAEIAGQYLKKGSQVYVEGRLQTRKWTDKEGIERWWCSTKCAKRFKAHETPPVFWKMRSSVAGWQRHATKSKRG